MNLATLLLLICTSSLPQPNILIVVADDHAGGLLGIDGDPRRASPNLDHFASQGVRFDRAYCNAPLCTPSRQSFITGKLPHSVGVTRLMTPLPDQSLTLGHRLGLLGYDTAAFGKMHFHSTMHHGFDQRIDSPDWLARLQKTHPQFVDPRSLMHPLKDPAAKWLNAACQPMNLPETEMEAHYLVEKASEFFAKPRNRPFALVVGFYEPHCPFPFPNDRPQRFHPEEFAAPSLTQEDRRDRPKNFAKLSDPEVRSIQAAYFRSLAFLDGQVGQLLAGLEASGKADNTIVVYLGDNGYLLGQHGRFEKHCFFEQAIRVPLIFRWPGHLPKGRKVEEMVELLDLAPTFYDLIGQEVPTEFQGRSLAPLLRGDAGAKGHDVVFSEYLETEEAMVRSDRFKLILGTGAHPRKDGYESGNEPTEPFEKLYDLQEDPGETRNVAGKPEFRPALDELKRRMKDRLSTGRNLDTSGSIDQVIHRGLVATDR